MRFRRHDKLFECLVHVYVFEKFVEAFHRHQAHKWIRNSRGVFNWMDRGNLLHIVVIFELRLITITLLLLCYKYDWFDPVLK